MRIQTFSIIAGSEACNARCPFCISKMTPPCGVELKQPQVNWRNFGVACELAKQSGVTTAMFTGKGEPTLFPEQISEYLERMAVYEFPLIEMQTNGIRLAEEPEQYKEHLGHWHDDGMTTIAISIVHYLPEPNRKIYLPYKKDYIDLPKLIQTLHGYGFSVRLTCIAANMFIDSAKKVEDIVSFAQLHRVEQLTITPVNKPEHPEHREAWDWTNTHHLRPEQLQDIIDYLQRNATPLMTLAHGAVVYDLHGQNICLNNCLSVDPKAEEMRNLIFFPDGHLRYYWQYPGAILL